MVRAGPGCRAGDYDRANYRKVVAVQEADVGAGLDGEGSLARSEHRQ